MPVSFASLPQTGASVVSTIEVVSARQNIVNPLFASSEKKEVTVVDNALALKAKAEAIDTYFEERGMPLAGTGMKMVEEAEKNGIDWRLLPAIAVRESTGGKFACKKVTFSPFGWGSCKINFKSNDHAIETVAKNLGGNNPNTAHHYDAKSTLEILNAYNPPSIVPKYAAQVMAIMDKIGPEEINTEVALNPSFNQ